MPKLSKKAKWAGGLAEWQEGNTTYLSVAFTYKVDEAVRRATAATVSGHQVVVGGPAVFLPQIQRRFVGVATLGNAYPEAVIKHNVDATFASRGCPVGCWFCIVPKLEGREFTLYPDFTVRPILCDNNLSGLPFEYQQHIIQRYKHSGVPLLDANSGFEPRTFSDDIYMLWRDTINKGRGPWRFAYDDMKERDDCLRVMQMLRAEPASRKRVYVLIGNEPFAECMMRIDEVIAHGCEPHVQPVMALNTLIKKPLVRHDWTEQLLKDVARWANGFVWRKAPFKDYDRKRTNRKV